MVDSGVYTYSCTCTAGYSGRDCEVDVNECATLPNCLNGGVCTESGRASSVLANEFACSCIGNWGGLICNVNQCPTIYLGPDIGEANVFTYNDENNDCELSMLELAKVCSDQHYWDCISFLQSSEHESPKCDPIYLGPDIGDVNVFEYHDEDGTCTLSARPDALIRTRSPGCRVREHLHWGRTGPWPPPSPNMGEISGTTRVAPRSC